MKCIGCNRVASVGTRSFCKQASLRGLYVRTDTFTVHAGSAQSLVSISLRGPNPPKAVRCELYRRQCCRVPLPELKEAQLLLQSSLDAATAAAVNPLDAGPRGAATKAQAAAQRAAVELGYAATKILDSLDCQDCGWETCML